MNLRLREATTIVILTLSLAACGGSSSSSSTMTTRSASPSASTTTSSLINSSTTTAASASHAATGSTSSSTSQTSTSFHQSAELPAVFTIGSSGRLSPSVISAPGKTGILLSVRTLGSSPHVLEVRTSKPKTLEVRPGARAHLLLSGLPNGSYVIEVDHHPAGRLIVGVAPGP